MWQTTFVLAAIAASAYFAVAGGLAHLGVPFPGAPPRRWRLPVAWICAAFAALLAVVLTAPYRPGLIEAFAVLYAAALSVALIGRALRMPQPHGARIEVFLRALRWLAAGVLAAAGAWAVVSPRADQPLLDALERTFPAIRAAYMGDAAASRASDAEVRAARESHRWPLGFAYLVLATSLVISLPRPSRMPRS